ncbi:glycine cleavage system aminomethyltransferase GcvT [Candidatus Saganbacteria bacterium]|nr:glycine cleavage system aminomethyltransferase GcvT [Candidatus Saganbacteria bacterium]
MSALKKTPLYNEHIKLGAKIVPFAGWEMPVSYPPGIIQEHLSVRNSCGMFDVSHMGIIDINSKSEIRNPNNEALDFILRIATNNASLLAINEGQYSVVCNEHGGTVDDIFVFRLEDRYRLVVNASNTEKVLEWFTRYSKDFENLTITNRTDIGILSVQGPKTKDILGVPVMPPRNHCSTWGDLFYSHTGYTGEDGFEFFIDSDALPNVFETLLGLGIPPCGLGARDTLRLEAGLPLYGHEYDDNTSILEVGYPWAVKFDHDFIGRTALEKQKEAGVGQKLVGLKFSDKAIPRQGTEVFADEKKIGVVTSGTFSPTLKIPIALALIAPDFSRQGLNVSAKIRDKLYPAVVNARKMV